ncbi:MAG: polysaccharide deacetylase family protein [Erysipelotrichaceae bacterium]
MRKKHPNIARCLLALSILIAFLIVSISWLGIDQRKIVNSEKIAVFGYHNLASNQAKNKYFKFDPWTSSISSFEKQMKYLKEHGYQSISLDEFYLWKKGKAQYSNKTVLITFDDSCYSSVELAKPILKKYGFKASTFVIGYSIPKTFEKYDESIKQHIPKDQLKDDETMKFYSHSYHQHRKIDGTYAVNAYSMKQLDQDIARAGQTTNIKYYAYPFGKYNDDIIKTLQNHNVKLAFSYNQFDKVNRNDANYSLPRFSVNAYTPMWLFKIMLNR